MNETAQSEESAADESVTQATLGKVAEESRAIASEAEITAIEEGGRQSVGGGISNPADRRLPLIARIYGIVMLIEGVVMSSCWRAYMRLEPCCRANWNSTRSISPRFFR